MRVIGLDIGGANIKASDGEAVSVSVPFPLWQNRVGLREALRDLLNRFNKPERIAAAMTGELADCFLTKRDGVAQIIDSLVTAAGHVPVQIWQTGGEFVDHETACELTPLVAAANWHALATWAGRMAPGKTALLVDVGSTTCDIIPIENGIPMPAGRTDPERLISGELVYTGVSRTPLCAVTDTLPYRGQHVPLAAEVFATMLDAYLLLGRIPEGPESRETANNQPATIDGAHDRMARMICADRHEVTLDEVREMAQAAADQQSARIGTALDRVLRNLPDRCRLVLTSGEGEFLAQDLTAASSHLDGATTISLAKALGPTHSRAACAFALARLGRERILQ